MGSHEPACGVWIDNLRYGVGTAQRGWLTSGDVINAWPLDELLRFLDKR